MEPQKTQNIEKRKDDEDDEDSEGKPHKKMRKKRKQRGVSLHGMGGDVRDDDECNDDEEVGAEAADEANSARSADSSLVLLLAKLLPRISALALAPTPALVRRRPLGLREPLVDLSPLRRGPPVVSVV